VTLTTIKAVEADFLVQSTNEICHFSPIYELVGQRKPPDMRDLNGCFAKQLTMRAPPSNKMPIKAIAKPTNRYI
jgi:hypothetical protein